MNGKPRNRVALAFGMALLANGVAGAQSVEGCFVDGAPAPACMCSGGCGSAAASGAAAPAGATSDPMVDAAGQVGAAIVNEIGNSIRKGLQGPTAEEQARYASAVKKERERQEAAEAKRWKDLCARMKDGCPGGVGPMDFEEYFANEQMVHQTLNSLEQTHSPELDWCKLHRPMFRSGTIDNGAMDLNLAESQRVWFSRCSARSDGQMRALQCGLVRVFELGAMLPAGERMAVERWRKDIARMRADLTEPLSGDAQSVKVLAPHLSVLTGTGALDTQLVADATVVRNEATGTSTITVLYAWSGPGGKREEAQSVLQLDASGSVTTAELPVAVEACLSRARSVPTAVPARPKMSGLELK